MPSNHLILCHPLLLLLSIFPSIRVFSNESAPCIKWTKYWSFSFSISPSNEYSGLISFRNDWFDLLTFQGTLKSLLQHHSSKASIFRCSAFFIVQLSYPYMTIKCYLLHSSSYESFCLLTYKDEILGHYIVSHSKFQNLTWSLKISGKSDFKKAFLRTHFLLLLYLLPKKRDIGAFCFSSHNASVLIAACLEN